VVDLETNDLILCTRIVDICGQILPLMSDTAECKAMKLEAYWILTNLALGPPDEVCVILGLESDLECEYNSSVTVIELVDQDLQRLLGDNVQDL
jgi:hypothetical protein